MKWIVHLAGGQKEEIEADGHRSATKVAINKFADFQMITLKEGENPEDDKDL